MATSDYAEVSYLEQEHETPKLLAGYLDRIGKEKLADTPQGEKAFEAGQSRRRARPGEAHPEEPPSGGQRGQEIPQLRVASRGSNPGGQHRSYPSRGQIRSREGLSLLHLRHLVDQTGRGQSRIRQGPHHKASGAHR